MPPNYRRDHHDDGYGRAAHDAGSHSGSSSEYESARESLTPSGSDYSYASSQFDDRSSASYERRRPGSPLSNGSYEPSRPSTASSSASYESSRPSTARSTGSYERLEPLNYMNGREARRPRDLLHPLDNGSNGGNARHDRHRDDRRSNNPHHGRGYAISDTSDSPGYPSSGYADSSYSHGGYSAGASSGGMSGSTDDRSASGYGSTGSDYFSYRGHSRR